MPDNAPVPGPRRPYATQDRAIAERLEGARLFFDRLDAAPEALALLDAWQDRFAAVHRVTLRAHPIVAARHGLA